MVLIIAILLWWWLGCLDRLERQTGKRVDFWGQKKHS